jgi:glycosyltransferase involved in cell wall biosynthesis
MAKTKLLILTSSFPRYPKDFAGCFVLEFAQALSDKYEIKVLAPACVDYPNKESWENIEITRFNYLWPKYFQLLDSAKDLQPLLEKSLFAKLQVIPFCIAFFWQAFKLAKKSDIICSHWLVPAGFIGSLIACLQKKPHLVVEHSGALHLLNKLPAGQYILRFISYYSKNLVVVSNQLKEKFSRLHYKAISKVSVIPMGINCSLYMPNNSYTPNRPKQILFLGRLAKIKGIDILLKALVNLSDVNLLIAGDGVEKKELEALANKLKVPAKFLGMVLGEEKIKLLQSCDIVVIPSIVLQDGRTEGTPVVCLEAFACGKPVVASNVGGIADLVINGQTGFLCEPANEKQLREQIVTLLNHKNYTLMGNQARELAKNYDWSVIARQIHSLLS